MLYRTNISFFLHCFDYYSFLELQLNQYKLFLFLRLSNHQVLFLEFYFAWYRISIKFFVKALFCWLFTRVHHIYWIIVHWSWNLSSGVIENCQWAISKPNIQICFSLRLMEVCGEGDGFCDCTCHNQYIDWIQGIYSSYSSLKWYR